MPFVRNLRTGQVHPVNEGHWSIGHENYEMYTPPVEAASELDLESMSLADLRAYAEENAIDTGNARTRAQYRSAIRAALAAG